MEKIKYVDNPEVKWARWRDVRTGYLLLSQEWSNYRKNLNGIEKRFGDDTEKKLTTFVEKVADDLPDVIILSEPGQSTQDREVILNINNEYSFNLKPADPFYNYYFPATNEVCWVDTIGLLISKISDSERPGGPDFIGVEELKKNPYPFCISSIDYGIRSNGFGYYYYPIVEEARKSLDDPEKIELLDNLEKETQELLKKRDELHAKTQEKYGNNIKRRSINLSNIILTTLGTKSLPESIDFIAHTSDRARLFFEPYEERIVAVPEKFESDRFVHDFSQKKEADSIYWLKTEILKNRLVEIIPKDARAWITRTDDYYKSDKQYYEEQKEARKRKFKLF